MVDVKMLKECETYLTKLFDLFMVAGIDTIEVGCLWSFVRIAGYSDAEGGTMQYAVSELLETTSVFDIDGDFLYLAYRVKENI